MQSGLTASAIPEDLLFRLHPERLDEAQSIADFLGAAVEQGVRFSSATSRRAEPQQLQISYLGDSEIELIGEKLERVSGSNLFLNCEMAGRPYFVSVEILSATRGMVRVRWPDAIYRAERRDRPRRQVAAGLPVTLSSRSAGELRGVLDDVSADGLGVSLKRSARLARDDLFRLRADSGPLAGAPSWTRLVDVRENGAWQRLGLEFIPSPSWSRLSPSPIPSPPSVEAGVDGVLAGPPDVRWIDVETGGQVAAIIDAVGDRQGAPAIVIPPAWGKTKETLLGLAAALLATFKLNSRSLTVIRFDGQYKKGEATNSPQCSSTGLENLNYTFSQGARDIEAVGRFLRRAPEFLAPEVLLLTFSVSSIEGRRALADDAQGVFSSWVSVVGASDPQSLIRVISGGVDYLGGAERGEAFGRQFVQGLLLDIDHAAEDALREQVAFLSDAKRDFDRIDVPVTWFHGEYDAWASLDRVIDALSSGAQGARKLHVIQTGHQLRSSDEAAGIFDLVAKESMRLLGSPADTVGRPVKRELQARARLERKRLRPETVDTRSFWTDYLLGRDRTLGFELVTGTSAFRQLMRAQVQALSDCARVDSTILDLGSGTGALLREFSEKGVESHPKVLEVDYVVGALSRARASSRHSDVGFVAANLDDRNAAIPFRAGFADGAVCSLLVNYLEHPERLIREIVRVLRPGGRVVVSALREDADTSQICVRGIAELRSGRAVQEFGASGERRVDEALPGFVSDAGRLLDLEERGIFRLWSARDLQLLLERAGFDGVQVTPTFGDPAQAWLAVGQKL